MKKLLYKNSSISYSDSGKGTAVVLLHGFLENKSMWDFCIPKLTKKNRVIAIDLLGHGDTESLGYVHTMEENAEVVHEVLKHLRIRKAIFVGHSMGGYVALAFAEKYPEKIKGLVLQNTTSKADNEEKKTNRDRAIKAVKQNHTNFVRLSVGNLFSEDNRERLALEIERVKTEALKTPLQGIVASLEGMKIREDRTPILLSNDYPKLIILGEKDPVLHFEENSKLAIQANIELVTFTDGHMSHIENREALLRVLLDFVKKV